MTKSSELVRWPEAQELLASVEGDLVLSQLMNQANYCALRRFIKQENLPVADFDQRFFLEVMQELFANRDVLKRILAGEDLRVFTDADVQPAQGAMRS